MKEVKNILRILKETKNFIIQDNPNELKNLSNQTIHIAAISQDPDNIIVAVLIYSLGKVLERDYYKKMDGWSEFYKTTLTNLDEAIKSLTREQIEETRNALGKIRNSLNKIDTDLSEYIKDVFKKAEINKAFKLYEHGLSSEQTAKLLGVTLWDMASYIGQSHIADAKISVSLPVKNRIKIAEEIFK